MPPITQMVKLIIIGAVLIAAAAAIVLIRRRRGTGSLEEIICTGIARHAGLYDGLYEGLCQILAHEEVLDRDTLKEWCGRTSRLEDEPAYCAAFSQLFDGALEAPETEYREKLTLLSRLIAKAGISRVEAKTVVYDPSVKSSYLYLGEGAPADGEVYNVLKACWVFEGQTVEQGVIMKGEM